MCPEQFSKFLPGLFCLLPAGCTNKVYGRFDMQQHFAVSVEIHHLAAVEETYHYVGTGSQY